MTDHKWACFDGSSMGMFQYFQSISIHVKTCWGTYPLVICYIVIEAVAHRNSRFIVLKR